MNELVNGIYTDETRDRLLSIVERMIEQQEIQGLILGGTELPFILREENARRIPFLNTTRIHVEQVVSQMLSD
jgi:aspartate racemase